MRQSTKNTYNISDILCKKCSLPMYEISHKRITEKQLKKPFYYSKWFMCECNWMFLREEDKVYNSNEYKEYLKIDEEMKDTTAHLF